jgi:hypothetical protein
MKRRARTKARTCRMITASSTNYRLQNIGAALRPYDPVGIEQAKGFISNPSFATVIKVLSALGVKLHATPADA